MSVQQSIVNGFTSRRGLITYSMFGSRNGSRRNRGLFGYHVASIKGSRNQYHRPTVNSYAWPATRKQWLLPRKYRNQNWDAQPADIILMSWGADMSSSGGAGGHVGAMIDDTYFISCDYSTQGAVGQAINTLGTITIAGINQLILRFGGMLTRHHRRITKRTHPYSLKRRHTTKRTRSSMLTVSGKSNATISRPSASTGPRTVFLFRWLTGSIRTVITCQTEQIETLKRACSSRSNSTKPISRTSARVAIMVATTGACLSLDNSDRSGSLAGIRTI